MRGLRGQYAASGEVDQPSPRTLALIAFAAIAATLVAIWIIFANFYQIENPDHSGHFPWLGAALVWVFAGVLTWLRWPSSRIGPLMILAGFAHFTYVPSLTAISPLWLLSSLLSGLELLLVALVFLSYPTGRLTHPTDRRLFAVLVAWWAATAIVGTLADPHDLNPIPVIRDEGAQAAIFKTFSVIGAVLYIVVAIRVISRWREAPASERPLRTPVVVALIPYLVVLALEWLDRLIGANVLTDLANNWPGGLTDYGFPLAVLYVLWRTQQVPVVAQTAESAAG